MDLEEEFHQAVGNDDAEKVEQILSTGFRCYGKNRDEEYPLWVAARRGNVRMLRALVEAGETPKLGSGNRSVLFVAAEHGHADAVAFLGKRFDKLVVSKSFVHDSTPFCCAVRNGHVQVVKVLLELDASVEDKDYMNRTALVIAVENGDEEMVKMLLETKICIDELDGRGRTALHHAMETRNLRIAEMLLKAGATSSVLRGSDPSAFETAAKDGYTSGLELMMKYDNAHMNPIGRALEWSVLFGKVGVTKFLLGVGTDPNHRFPNGNILFEKCRGDEGLEIAEMLVDAGANPNTVSMGRSFLHFAVARRWPTLVRKLIAAGAAVDARDKKYDNTPLIDASLHAEAEIVKILIDAGANPNAINKKDRTALWWAARNVDADTTKLLLGAGANPNLREAVLPLHEAIGQDSIEIAKLLLDAGADIDADDDVEDVYTDSEHFVLGYATKRKNSAMVDFLLEAGADPNIGLAFYRAIKRQDENLTKKLLDHGADPNAPCVALARDETPLDIAWARRADNIIKILAQAGVDPTTFNPCVMRVGGDPAKTHESVVLLRNQPRVPTLSILCLRIIKLKRNGVHIPDWLPPILLAFPWEWEREDDDEPPKRSREESEEEGVTKRQK